MTQRPGIHDVYVVPKPATDWKRTTVLIAQIVLTVLIAVVFLFGSVQTLIALAALSTALSAGYIALR